jgi:hypothetical protein
VEGAGAYDQLLADTLRLVLTRGEMLSQPGRQHLSVRDAPLPAAGTGLAEQRSRNGGCRFAPSRASARKASPKGCLTLKYPYKEMTARRQHLPFSWGAPKDWVMSLMNLQTARATLCAAVIQSRAI